MVEFHVVVKGRISPIPHTALTGAKVEAQWYYIQSESALLPASGPSSSNQVSALSFEDLTPRSSPVLEIVFALLSCLLGLSLAQPLTS